MTLLVHVLTFGHATVEIVLLKSALPKTKRGERRLCHTFVASGTERSHARAMPKWYIEEMDVALHQGVSDAVWNAIIDDSGAGLQEAGVVLAIPEGDPSE